MAYSLLVTGSKKNKDNKHHKNNVYYPSISNSFCFKKLAGRRDYWLHSLTVKTAKVILSVLETSPLLIFD